MSTSTHLPRLFVFFLLVGLCAAQTQNTTDAAKQSVPRLLKYSGTALDASGNPLTGPQSVTFSIYGEQTSESPIWTETQTVTADELGRFSALIGSSRSEGVPIEPFSDASARWLGISVNSAPEQPRTMLISVPYSFTSGVALNAERLSDLEAGDFVLTKAARERLASAGKLSSSQQASGDEIFGAGDNGTVNHLAKFSGTGNNIALVDSGIVEVGGLLGVGTTNPGAPLELVGNGLNQLMRAPNAASYAGMRFYNDQASGFRALEIDYAGSTYAGALVAGGPVGESGSVTTTGAFPLTLGTANTARLAISGAGQFDFKTTNPVTVTAAGLVGIGTTNPGASLDVTGNGLGMLFRSTNPSSYAGLRFYNDQGSGFRALEVDYSGSAYASALVSGGPVGESASIATTGNFPLTLGTANVMRMTITGTGNVGIGTAVPTSRLHLTGPAASTLNLDKSGSTLGRFGLYVGDGSAGSISDDNYIRSLNTTLHFLAGPGAATEVATFANSGNVGIGVTSPTSKLETAGTSATQIVLATQNGAGTGSFNVGTPPPAAIRGDATAATNYVLGVLGTVSTPSGAGVVGMNLAATGNSSGAGVRGITTSNAAGTGVWGEATATVGDNVGVYGTSASSSGTGVIGEATSTALGADSAGVYGVARSNGGAGIFGESTWGGAGSSGNLYPVGVWGRIQSTSADFTVSGAAGLFDTSSPTGNILIGRAGPAPNRVFRVDGTGKGFFNGGTQTNGADFAESVSIREAKSKYQPGDVIAIDTTGTRRFTKVSKAYSTLVAGIYSTKPGVLATPHGIDDSRVESEEIPLAVVGIVPCKVTNENGPIKSGDLLVSSSLAGYAMKGTDSKRMNGAVIGKALSDMKGTTGVIEVLVSLQ